MVSSLDAGRPSGLRRPTFYLLRAVRFCPIDPLLSEPLLVVVLLGGPKGLGLWVVAPFEDAVAIVWPNLNASVGG
jgi:hypothetical protein